MRKHADISKNQTVNSGAIYGTDVAYACETVGIMVHIQQEIKADHRIWPLLCRCPGEYFYWVAILCREGYH